MGFLKKNRAAAAITAAALAFIAAGVLRGEAETVLSKAINICLECIGLG